MARMQRREPNVSAAWPTLGVAVAAVLWGIWWMPLRALEAAGLSGDWSSVFVYTVAAVALLPVAFARRRQFRAGGWPVAAAGILYGVALVTWNHALITGEVVRVSLLFYLMPVWATLLGAAFLSERLTAYRVAAVACGLAGAAVVLGIEGGFPTPRNVGEWMALVSGVVFALSVTYARSAGGGGWFEGTYLALPSAAVLAVVFVYLAPQGSSLSGGAIWSIFPALLLAVLLWHVPSIGLTLWGAGHLGPARVSILMLLEIVAAAGSAALLAGEPFGWREAVGCLLILGSGALEGLAHLRARPAAGIAESRH